MKDGLFPIFCVLCKKEGTFLCEDCERHVIADPKWQKKSKDIVGVYTLYSYKQPSIKILVELFKYKQIEELHTFFHKFLFQHLSHKKELFLHYYYIVPVPLHKRRYNERGFNQAEYLAKSIALALNKEYVPLLERKKYTKQQVKMNREKRLRNLENAFVINEEFGTLQGKNILLVDDVYTTGATLEECAKVLHDAGANIVGGITFARG
ncbi:MAG: ComF family protein [Candidatus Magasanikbacteria bacterium]